MPGDTCCLNCLQPWFFPLDAELIRDRSLKVDPSDGHITECACCHLNGGRKDGMMADRIRLAARMLPNDQEGFIELLERMNLLERAGAPTGAPPQTPEDMDMLSW